MSITKNEQDALDIVQDSYIKAFKSISTLNTPELFDNWFNRIVANTGKNYIKKKKPLLFADMENDAPVEWNEEEFNKDYLPQEAMDTKETSRLLMEIINELSEDRRLCILMYYYQDMSVKEIAEVLDLPVSNVKYKLLSARAEIKKGVEALEEKDTKLYGIFPFMLFPALFRSMQKEFSMLHLSPQYSQLSLSVSGLHAQSAAGQAVREATEETAKEVAKNAAKKGFFSTLAGKSAIIAATAVIAGGIITAAVIATNSSDDKKNLGSLNNSDNTNNNISQEETNNVQGNTEENIILTTDVSPNLHYNSKMYVHVPMEFEADFDDSYMDNMGYFSYHKKFENDIIYFNFDVDIRFGGDGLLNDDGIDEYNLEDVPKIAFDGDLNKDTKFSSIKYGFRNIFEDHYNTLSGCCEKTVDSEKYQTINGMSFINEKGIITLEPNHNDDGYSPLELTYTAYYTILKCPRQEHNNADINESGLTSLIVFSDRCNEETAKELDRVALEMIINSDWDSYCNNDTYFNSDN